MVNALWHQFDWLVNLDITSQVVIIVNVYFLGWFLCLIFSKTTRPFLSVFSLLSWLSVLSVLSSLSVLSGLSVLSSLSWLPYLSSLSWLSLLPLLSALSILSLLWFWLIFSLKLWLNLGLFFWLLWDGFLDVFDFGFVSEITELHAFEFGLFL